MESSSSASLSPKVDPKGENEVKVYDFTLLQKESKVPKEFTWPAEDLVKTSEEELDVPLIDMEAMKGNEAAKAAAAETVRKACTKHGFFEITNHGVDPDIIAVALEEVDSIFGVPLGEKLNGRRNAWGFSVAHADRFGSRLPWKETFTFPYKHINKESGQPEKQVVDFFKSLLGQDPEVQYTG